MATTHSTSKACKWHCSDIGGAEAIMARALSEGMTDEVRGLIADYLSTREAGLVRPVKFYKN